MLPPLYQLTFSYLGEIMDVRDAFPLFIFLIYISIIIFYILQLCRFCSQDTGIGLSS